MPDGGVFEELFNVYRETFKGSTLNDFAEYIKNNPSYVRSMYDVGAKYGKINIPYSSYKREFDKELGKYDWESAKKDFGDPLNQSLMDRRNRIADRYQSEIKVEPNQMQPQVKPEDLVGAVSTSQAAQLPEQGMSNDVPPTSALMETTIDNKPEFMASTSVGSIEQPPSPTFAAMDKSYPERVQAAQIENVPIDSTETARLFKQGIYDPKEGLRYLFNFPLTKEEEQSFVSMALRQPKLSTMLNSYDTRSWYIDKMAQYKNDEEKVLNDFNTNGIPAKYAKPNNPLFGPESKYQGAKTPDGLALYGKVSEMDEKPKGPYHNADAIFSSPTEVLKAFSPHNQFNDPTIQDYQRGAGFATDYASRVTDLNMDPDIYARVVKDRLGEMPEAAKDNAAQVFKQKFYERIALMDGKAGAFDYIQKGKSNYDKAPVSYSSKEGIPFVTGENSEYALAKQWVDMQDKYENISPVNRELLVNTLAEQFVAQKRQPIFQGIFSSKVAEHKLEPVVEVYTKFEDEKSKIEQDVASGNISMEEGKARMDKISEMVSGLGMSISVDHQTKMLAGPSITMLEKIIKDADREAEKQVPTVGMVGGPVEYTLAQSINGSSLGLAYSALTGDRAYNTLGYVPSESGTEDFIAGIGGLLIDGFTFFPVAGQVSKGAMKIAGGIYNTARGTNYALKMNAMNNEARILFEELVSNGVTGRTASEIAMKAVTKNYGRVASELNKAGLDFAQWDAHRNMSEQMYQNGGGMSGLAAVNATEVMRKGAIGYITGAMLHGTQLSGKAAETWAKKRVYANISNRNMAIGSIKTGAFLAENAVFVGTGATFNKDEEISLGSFTESVMFLGALKLSKAPMTFLNKMFYKDPAFIAQYKDANKRRELNDRLGIVYSDGEREAIDLLFPGNKVKTMSDEGIDNLVFDSGKPTAEFIKQVASDQVSQSLVNKLFFRKFGFFPKYNYVPGKVQVVEEADGSQFHVRLMDESGRSLIDFRSYYTRERAMSDAREVGESLAKRDAVLAFDRHKDKESVLKAYNNQFYPGKSEVSMTRMDDDMRILLPSGRFSRMDQYFNLSLSRNKQLWFLKEMGVDPDKYYNDKEHVIINQEKEQPVIDGEISMPQNGDTGLDIIELQPTNGIEVEDSPDKFYSLSFDPDKVPDELKVFNSIDVDGKAEFVLSGKDLVSSKWAMPASPKEAEPTPVEAPAPKVQHPSMNDLIVRAVMGPALPERIKEAVFNPEPIKQKTDEVKSETSGGSGIEGQKRPVEKAEVKPSGGQGEVQPLPKENEVLTPEKPKNDKQNEPRLSGEVQVGEKPVEKGSGENGGTGRDVQSREEKVKPSDLPSGETEKGPSEKAVPAETLKAKDDVIRRISKGEINSDDAAIELTNKGVEVTDKMFDELTAAEEAFTRSIRGVRPGDTVTIIGKNGENDRTGNYRGDANGKAVVVLDGGMQMSFDKGDIKEFQKKIPAEPPSMAKEEPVSKQTEVVQEDKVLYTKRDGTKIKVSDLDELSKATDGIRPSLLQRKYGLSYANATFIIKIYNEVNGKSPDVKPESNKPVSERYYVREYDSGDINYKEVEGKKVDLVVDGDFFVARDDSGRWTVYEGSTGLKMSDGFHKTRKEAIDKANENIEKQLKSDYVKKGGTIASLINRTRELQGSTPRYVEPSPETAKAPEPPMEKVKTVKIGDLIDLSPSVKNEIERVFGTKIGEGDRDIDLDYSRLINIMAGIYQVKKVTSGTIEALIKLESVLSKMEDDRPSMTKKEFIDALWGDKKINDSTKPIIEELINGLKTEKLPVYIKFGERVKIGGTYIAKTNKLGIKSAESILHEFGHFGFYNLLTPEERIDFMRYMLDSGKQEDLDSGSIFGKKVTEGKSRFQVNMYSVQEYFAEQFNQYVTSHKLDQQGLEKIYSKLWDYFRNAILRLLGKDVLDPNMRKFMEKIIDLERGPESMLEREWGKRVKAVKTTDKDVMRFRDDAKFKGANKMEPLDGFNTEMREASAIEDPVKRGKIMDDISNRYMEPRANFENESGVPKDIDVGDKASAIEAVDGEISNYMKKDVDITPNLREMIDEGIPMFKKSEMTIEEREKNDKDKFELHKTLVDTLKALKAMNEDMKINSATLPGILGLAYHPAFGTAFKEFSGKKTYETGADLKWEHSNVSKDLQVKWGSLSSSLQEKAKVFNEAIGTASNLSNIFKAAIGYSVAKDLNYALLLGKAKEDNAKFNAAKAAVIDGLKSLMKDRTKIRVSMPQLFNSITSLINAKNNQEFISAFMDVENVVKNGFLAGHMAMAKETSKKLKLHNVTFNNTVNKTIFEKFRNISMDITARLKREIPAEIYSEYNLLATDAMRGNYDFDGMQAFMEKYKRSLEDIVNVKTIVNKRNYRTIPGLMEALDGVTTNGVREKDGLLQKLDNVLNDLETRGTKPTAKELYGLTKSLTAGVNRLRELSFKETVLLDTPAEIIEKANELIDRAEKSLDQFSTRFKDVEKRYKKSVLYDITSKLMDNAMPDSKPLTEKMRGMFGVNVGDQLSFYIGKVMNLSVRGRVSDAERELSVNHLKLVHLEALNEAITLLQAGILPSSSMKMFKRAQVASDYGRLMNMANNLIAGKGDRFFKDLMKNTDGNPNEVASIAETWFKSNMEKKFGIDSKDVKDFTIIGQLMSSFQDLDNDANQTAINKVRNSMVKFTSKRFNYGNDEMRSLSMVGIALNNLCHASNTKDILGIVDKKNGTWDVVGFHKDVLGNFPSLLKAREFANNQSEQLSDAYLDHYYQAITKGTKTPELSRKKDINSHMLKIDSQAYQKMLDNMGTKGNPAAYLVIRTMDDVRKALGHDKDLVGVAESLREFYDLQGDRIKFLALMNGEKDVPLLKNYTPGYVKDRDRGPEETLDNFFNQQATTVGRSFSDIERDGKVHYLINNAENAFNAYVNRVLPEFHVRSKVVNELEASRMVYEDLKKQGKQEIGLFMEGIHDILMEAVQGQIAVKNVLDQGLVINPIISEPFIFNPSRIYERAFALSRYQMLLALSRPIREAWSNVVKGAAFIKPQFGEKLNELESERWRKLIYEGAVGNAIASKRKVGRGDVPGVGQVVGQAGKNLADIWLGLGDKWTSGKHFRDSFLQHFREIAGEEFNLEKHEDVAHPDYYEYRAKHGEHVARAIQFANQSLEQVYTSQMKLTSVQRPFFTGLASQGTWLYDALLSMSSYAMMDSQNAYLAMRDIAFGDMSQKKYASAKLGSIMASNYMYQAIGQASFALLKSGVQYIKAQITDDTEDDDKWQWTLHTLRNQYSLEGIAQNVVAGATGLAVGRYAGIGKFVSALGFNIGVSLYNDYIKENPDLTKAEKKIISKQVELWKEQANRTMFIEPWGDTDSGWENAAKTALIAFPVVNNMVDQMIQNFNDVPAVYDLAKMAVTGDWKSADHQRYWSALQLANNLMGFFVIHPAMRDAAKIIESERRNESGFLRSYVDPQTYEALTHIGYWPAPINSIKVTVTANGQKDTYTVPKDQVMAVRKKVYTEFGNEFKAKMLPGDKYLENPAMAQKIAYEGLWSQGERIFYGYKYFSDKYRKEAKMARLEEIKKMPKYKGMNVYLTTEDKN